MIHQYILRHARRLINKYTLKDKSLLTFIPHYGCEIDGSNLINYKSDSALTFFHYIAKKYGKKYKYQIAASEKQKADLENKISSLYPDLDINIIYHPVLCHKRFSICKAISKSFYVFTSQAIEFDYLSNKNQEIYFLGYYAGNFKNDMINQYQSNIKWYNRVYTKFFSPSLLFSQINSNVYNVPLSKFYITGLVRNDNLYEIYHCPQLDNWINLSVDYEVKNIFLYTPTHRDYEMSSNVKRGIMGFDLNRNEIESYLRSHNAVIIVKLHSRQNLETLKEDLPSGILLHKSSDEYGLNELLQKANYLISDYTSTYFDFLLLDRPVLFNFYDFDKYQESRGFSFDPLDPIIAGDIFIDQKSFIEKMSLVIKEDKYREKRHFVRNLLFKYQDNCAAERVYNYVFNDKKITKK